jgi:hypothetical protein
MPEAFCSHCGALRTSRTPVCSSCGGELDTSSAVAAPAPAPGIIARQPRTLLIALVAALLVVAAFLVLTLLG